MHQARKFRLGERAGRAHGRKRPASEKARSQLVGRAAVGMRLRPSPQPLPVSLALNRLSFTQPFTIAKIFLDRQPFPWGGLSLSPDESWLAYAQIDEAGSNLMLVEGFR